MAVNDVAICNAAISHLGGAQFISSLSSTDGSVYANYCAQFYPIAKRELLEEFNWSFARTRTALGSVTNPSQVWGYAYQLPSDCIDPLRVIPQSTATSSGTQLWYSDYTQLQPNGIALLDEGGSSKFEMEGLTLLTNEPNAVLVYKKDISDATLFSPGFASALSYLLAAYLAGPVVKGEKGAKTAQAFRKIALDMGAEKAAKDASGAQDDNEFVSASIQSRR